MKKIFYFLSTLMVVFSSCDPMEDTYEELDALPRAQAEFRKVNITLSKENYESFKTAPSTVNKGLYFTSEAEAGSIVPSYLNTAYGQLEEGDIINVTYNQFVSAQTNAVSSRETYTVTAEDYTAAGISNSRFNLANGDADAIKFLNYKYPGAAEGKLVVLTFNGYNSNVSSTAVEMTDSFYFINGAWANAYHVTDADYTSVDNGRYKNFSSSLDDQLPSFFNKFLSQSVLAPKTGEIRYVSYKYFSGGVTQQAVTAMQYNGTMWVKAPSVVTVPATLAFSRTNGTWKPDLTIRYTMVPADYTWISTQPSLGTEAQRTNLGSFGNFYMSFAGNDYNWSDANLVTALAGFLKYKFPNAEVGQKVALTYVFYKSGAKVGTLTFQKQASGEFTLVK
ncbi:hypothetical protein GU926_08440 [Nibribacter ruber]|uniref:DUF5017 domain-containing protein n=1 Tax=Nibribacter ruber TaxID=2698458 RepID=A0A6P1NYJ2_9BACT|nr:hypothetical protein [Nibribacter ruber]QHL87464.1 hypothetical protein GU926_08440 [Nibribacter ruber]